MDIIIRNGIIQTGEEKRIKEIKNEQGLLKKDFIDYIKGVPGPYYDMFDSHICVVRKHNQIPNFIGPQVKNKVKLIDTKDYNKKVKYCIICHSLMKPNPSFSSKRKIFVEEDTFMRKKEIEIDLQRDFKKLKIENSKPHSMSIDVITEQIKKTIINSCNTWYNISHKLYMKNQRSNFNFVHENYKRVQSKIINKYYQFVYQLTKPPILYPISVIETKLIWPWNLTKYQKFRLENPDYKLSSLFEHRKNYKITENYVIIE